MSTSGEPRAGAPAAGAGEGGRGRRGDVMDWPGHTLKVAGRWTPAALCAVSGLRIGWLIVFCLVLGMYWEWRPVARAGVQWRLVRSFRSWGSLTAPATAVATVLAGAAAVSMTQQPTDGTLQQQSSYSAPGP
ncbi:hypothetical protein [Streptomyces sp. NPDC058335]|uniref:hypothetical protein n=1 Tax=Streptomyces sp. NPDC058335 TaxID=3346451 RepID=UPI003646ABB1